jgi:hypothetical protein
MSDFDSDKAVESWEEMRKSRDEAHAEIEVWRGKLAEQCGQTLQARAIADEQAEHMKFCSRCKPVPRPWAKDDA